MTHPPRQSLPFCSRCRAVGTSTDPLDVWDFIQEHGVVGFIAAENPVIPVTVPMQPNYLEVALESV